MGATNVTDAITNETIYEGDKVIAILLSAARPRLLGFSSTSSYKISSFPMAGKWDGNLVIPHDDLSFSSTFNQIMVTAGEGNQKRIPDSFIEVQDRVSRDPIINGNTYSLMVIREGTYDLLASMKNMDFQTSGATIEGDIKKSEALVAEFLRVNELVDQGDNSHGIRRQCSTLKAALEFSSIETHIGHLDLPSVSSALFPDSLCAFSPRLIQMVNDLYGDGGVSGYVQEYGELPDTYMEVVSQLHKGKFIATAMDVMGRQLMPSLTTIARQDSSYNLEMASKLIQREISTKLEFAKGSPSFLADIDKEIDGLKKMLVDVVRLRKGVERDINGMVNGSFDR